MLVRVVERKSGKSGLSSNKRLTLSNYYANGTVVKRKSDESGKRH